LLRLAFAPDPCRRAFIAALPEPETDSRHLVKEGRVARGTPVALKSHIYWWMAEECERRAAETEHAEVKTAYEALAGSWRSLADRQLKRDIILEQHTARLPQADPPRLLN
jgi:hypothetical protein